MRTRQYLLSTLKEIPADAEITSHQLMLRSGMIRNLASGLYIWLPTGLRVLKKIKDIVRKEMNNIGAIEISMPIVQPSDLWKKSGRLEKYGPELLRFADRNGRFFILSPTHEEVITNLIRYELGSYKQLPLSFFAIQTKFRDEMRPRFGVIRSREFIMKDAYSFHISQESLHETYEKMHQAYRTIFTRLGLNFCVVQADTGPMGGNFSHEFQALVPNGEDSVILSDSSEYASNIEFAEALPPSVLREEAMENIRLVDTQNIKSITELVEKFNFSVKKTVKTLLVKAAKENICTLIGLLVRGDHELNIIKAEKLPQVSKPLTFATEEEIRAIINAGPGYLGPVNMPVPLVIDHAVATMSNFVAGANIDGKHFFGINWDRDVITPTVADIRNVVKGDPSPDGKGKIVIRRSIEIGHIFKLGIEYSRTMSASVQMKNGRHQILMGCYGIGITRLVAALIEQNHDKKGIIWADSVAPFQVAIIPVNMHKSYRVQEVAEKLYFELLKKNIDVLIDDRKERPGVMFSDIELIGIPHIIIISDRNLHSENVEYKCRRNNEKKIIKIDEIFSFLTEIFRK